MPRKDQTVAADILHVDWEIRNGLRTVHEEEGIVAELGSYLFDIIDFSCYVRNMSDGNYFHFITIFLIKIFPIDLILGVDIEKFYGESFSLC